MTIFWLEYLHRLLEFLEAVHRLEPRGAGRLSWPEAARILQVAEDACPEVIKAAYRALVMKHYPDRSGDVRLMQRLNAAYATLHPEPPIRPIHSIGKTLEELRVGSSATLTKTISDYDVARCAELTGDWNPLHFDEGFASQTRFKERIAHGLIAAGLLSGLLGMKLPGPGTVLVSLELRFLRPVKIGETITAQVEVVELIREKRRVRLRMTCLNPRGEEVIDGFALVKPPERG